MQNFKRSTGLSKVAKCNKNLERDLNSFNEYSLYKLPVIPINKACDISISINSLNEKNSDFTNNENTDSINKIEDINNSTNLDSDFPNKKIPKDTQIEDNEEIKDKIIKDTKIEDNKEIKKNKILKDPKIENQNNDQNINQINLKFKKIDKNNSFNTKNIQTCSTPIKDSDICLDSFLE